MTIKTPGTGSINFKETFGNNKGTTDREKAQFWLNIGYGSGVTDDNGEERFVSLPLGIPLDTQEHLATNSRNAEFAQFQAARNDLLDQIQDAAKSLAPGESRVLNLQIQLRRVNDEVADIKPEDNMFAKKLAL